MYKRSSRLLEFLCVIAAMPACASTFTISPIRAELSGGHRTCVLTLTNADEQPVVIQVHVLAWSQINGEEKFAETRELLVTPPVLQIPANGDQIVRVALRRDADATQELTYRVVFEEVPQATPANFMGLRVALRLSVPIFVAPAHARAVADLHWEAHRRPDGQMEIAAINQGTGHVQVTDFDVKLQGAPGALRGMSSKYILPGSRISWTLMPDAGSWPAPSAMGSLVVHGHSDQGDFSSDVAPSVL